MINAADWDQKYRTAYATMEAVVTAKRTLAQILGSKVFIEGLRRNFFQHAALGFDSEEADDHRGRKCDEAKR